MGYDGPIPLTHHGTVDACLDKGPGVIYWILFTSPADYQQILLRDGSDTSAGIIADMETGKEHVKFFRFDPPLPYYKGLFVDIVGNIDNFTIAYDPTEERR